VRGLTFQINKKLLQLKSTIPVQLHSFLHRLEKYKGELAKMDATSMEEFHSKFIKCFDEELKLGQVCAFPFPKEDLDIVKKVKDMKQDCGIITFGQEIENAVAECRAGTYGVIPRLMAEKEQLKSLIGSMRTAVIKFEDWYNYQFQSAQGK